MAALCLDASLETLRPLCYRGTHRLQGDLCRCFHEGSFQTVQVVATLLASHVLQNSPQFIVPGGWGLDSPRANPRHWYRPERSSAATPESSRLLGRNWDVLDDPFLTTEDGHVKFFHSSCSASSWYTQTPFTTLSCKNEDLSLSDGTHPTKPWRRKGDGIPAHSECTSRDVWADILLFWLLYCSSMVKDFSSMKRIF